MSKNDNGTVRHRLNRFHAIENRTCPALQPIGKGPQRAEGMFYPNNDAQPIVQIFEPPTAGPVSAVAGPMTQRPFHMIGGRRGLVFDPRRQFSTRVGAVGSRPGNYLKLLYGEAFRTRRPEESSAPSVLQWQP